MKTTRNPLTERARAFHSRQALALENYCIAAFCGAALGVLCALFI